MNKVDLLFMIDNSASMADKQHVFAATIPALVNRLVHPDCVQTDAAGNTTNRQPSTKDGACSPGLTLELAPLADIHIGVVTSSLGGHGSDSCDPKNNAANNDGARLISRGFGGGTVATWDGSSGFLQWDPDGKQTPPGETDATALAGAARKVIDGAGQTGCGYESSLEAWYRFLVDPNPPASVRPPSQPGEPALVEGVDEALLQQRAEFLRPDSLLAVIVLSDENDCSTVDGVLPKSVLRDGKPASGWTLSDNGSFPANYIASIGQLGGGAFRMKSGTPACATDPSSPACTYCYSGASGCQTLPFDEDPRNLRCWDQKRRFGVDMLYPVQRYVDGLRETQVFDLRGGADDSAPLVDNPIFQDLPYLRHEKLAADFKAGVISQKELDAGEKRLGDASTREKLPARSPRSVVFTAIVGVPWQDLAVDPTDLGKGYLPTDKVSWANLRATNGAPPLDPLMREAVEPRSGTHPITKETIGLKEGNVINGHERITEKSDLMYACRLPLNPPVDCTDPAVICDCNFADSDGTPSGTQAVADAAANPLCQKATGEKFGETQYWGKAYPGGRFVEVAHRLQGRSVLTSICTPNVTDGARADFGYRPTVDALVGKISASRKPPPSQ